MGRARWYYTDSTSRNKPPADRTPAIDTPPIIIPRDQHNISRANISEHALKVLYRLHKAGYAAYLVGGGVRDLLLGRHPKDFDIATDARPEEVRRLFRNCRLIGRRFRLAHIHFGREIIEVATFRGQPQDEDSEEVANANGEGMLVRDNVYGDLESDAWRRDFTVNALYYNIADFSVVDYTGGLEDLREGVLRMIGEPAVRFAEDPVRMLRAVRFAAKLEFRIPGELGAAIRAEAPRMGSVPPARLFDEVLKLFLSGHAQRTLELLREYQLFGHLFPLTEEMLEDNDPFALPMIRQAMVNTDARIMADRPVTPYFLYAVLLWPPVREAAARYREEGHSALQAMHHAADEVLARQRDHITIPRRIQNPIKDIWFGQWRLENRRGKRPLVFAEHPRFRAAYDFLLLRCDVGEVDPEACQWWTEFQEKDDEGRREMCNLLKRDRAPRKRRRRRKPRGQATPAQ